MGAMDASSFWEVNLYGLVSRFGVVPLHWCTWFDPYQGKVDSSRTQENNLGLGGNLVTKFADVLASLGRKFFHLYYDNFFNSVKLVTTLKAKFVKATGTIRENRTEKMPADF